MSTDLKLKQYVKTIFDVNECLQIEPENIKALLRKGQAFIGQSMLTEACDTFEKVLDLEASNQIAQTELATLRKKVPVKNAFRMTIEEVDESEPKKEKKIIRKSEKLDLPESFVPKLVRNIVVEDPTPFDKMLPKKKETKEKLIMPCEAQTSKKPSLIQEIQ